MIQTDDGHWMDDPVIVAGAVPKFDGLGLSKEDIAKFEREVESDNYEDMLHWINKAIAIYGKNRSLGNVADNIRAKLKEMNK